MPTPTDPSSAGTSRADLALAQALVLMAPLARWLLRSGVNYVGLSNAMKLVFLQEAAEELTRTGAKVTDSALSVLSGVHRKDVRALRDVAPVRTAFKPTRASKLFTRWLTDPAYRGPGKAADGAVALQRLPRSGPAPSFEALAREVSSDVHPRTLLEELVRLGLVTVEDDQVVLAATSFAPDPSDRSVQEIATANVADHLAAAVHNMTGDGKLRFLEQSVFARGLSEASAQQLAQLARGLWQPAFQAMVAEATRLVQADDTQPDAPMRMRFGVYYYHERPDGEAAVAAEQPVQKPRRAARKGATRRPARG